MVNENDPPEELRIQAEATREAVLAFFKIVTANAPDAVPAGEKVRAALASLKALCISLKPRPAVSAPTSPGATAAPASKKSKKRSSRAPKDEKKKKSKKHSSVRDGAAPGPAPVPSNDVSQSIDRAR